MLKDGLMIWFVITKALYSTMNLAIVNLFDVRTFKHIIFNIFSVCDWWALSRMAWLIKHGRLDKKEKDKKIVTLVFLLVLLIRV